MSGKGDNSAAQPVEKAPYRVRSFVDSTNSIVVRVEEWDAFEGKEGAYVRMYGDRLNYIVTCPSFLERFMGTTLEDKVKKAHTACRKECLDLTDTFYKLEEKRAKIDKEFARIKAENNLS